MTPESLTIVMPVYNEAPAAVFAKLRAMVDSLAATGNAGAFHFFVLSDTTNLLSIAARLATRTSFADVRLLLSWFVPTPPSTEVIESTVLGYGRHTQLWFQSAPAPTDDGDVLVIQIDSKGVPTATETELDDAAANEGAARLPRRHGIAAALREAASRSSRAARRATSPRTRRWERWS